MTEIRGRFSELDDLGIISIGSGAVSQEETRRAGQH